MFRNFYYCFQFLLLAGLFIPCSVFSQKNVELVANLPYPNMGSPIILNDVWGYVDEQGTEYALVGTFTGVSIVSLLDPANPEELFFVPGINSIWRDIKTYQSIAYVSNESGNGIQLIDLSNLPAEISFKDTVISGVNTIHNLYQDEGFLYAVGLNTLGGGMMILDLRQDPWNPEFAGSYTNQYVHDVYVRNKLAYTAEIFSGQLSVVDVSDPVNTSILGTKRYGNAVTHNTWLNDSSNVCFTTDERSRAFVIAWDVSDPENIEELDRIRSSLSRGRATPHNVHVLNDFLVTSYYKDGVQIVDANRPQNLVEVGYYDTFPDSLEGTDGCWGSYPFLPSGLILASDIKEGLFILQPDYQRAAYFEGKILDAVSLQPLQDAQIEILGLHALISTNVLGEFATGFISHETTDVVISRNGYLPDTVGVTFQQGEVTRLDIQLEPNQVATFDLQVVDDITEEPIDSVQLLFRGVNLGLEYELLSSDNTTLRNTFADDTYELIAGKWGYQTTSQTIDFQSDTISNIVVRMKSGYYDDFIFDFKWETTDSQLQGFWQRSVPSGTMLLDNLLNPNRDVETDFGDQAYITDNRGGSFADGDVDNGPFILKSPRLDLTIYQDPWINYHWWMVSITPDLNFEAGNDTLWTILSNPTDTVRIAYHTGPLNNSWNQTSIRVQDFMSPTTDMQVSFEIKDLPPNHFVEAGIDLFSVTDSMDLTTTSSVPIISPKPSVYPNPVGSVLYLTNAPDMIPEHLTWELYNASGTLLNRGTGTNEAKLQPISFPYPPGMYLMILKHPDYNVQHFKLIKTQEN